MKPILCIVYSLCFVTLIPGCNQLNKVDAVEDVLVLDFTKKYDEISFKLSDISDDIKLVRLETTDNSLIKYFNGYVGEKYIISVGNDKVMQFSADGKFMRTIAVRGKGPGEFTQIDAWDIDENEQFFLYHNNSKNYIDKYNLDSGQHERNIPFVEYGYLSKLLSINDSTLAILPGMFSRYGYLYFYQSIGGQIIEGIKKEPVPHPGTWAGQSPVFTKATDNSILFQPSESDTIFRIEGAEMQPIFSLKVEEPQKIGDKTIGFHVSFLHMRKDKIFLYKSGYESIVTQNSSSIKTLGIEYLIFNRKNNVLQKISPIYYDNLEIELNSPLLSFPRHNQFVIQYQALDFVKLLDKAIKDDSFPDSKRDTLKKLYSEISEYDNPILITGKLR